MHETVERIAILLKAPKMDDIPDFHGSWLEMGAVGHLFSLFPAVVGEFIAPLVQVDGWVMARADGSDDAPDGLALVDDLNNGREFGIQGFYDEHIPKGPKGTRLRDSGGGLVREFRTRRESAFEGFHGCRRRE
jgi:hypothetical protein